MTNQEIQCGSIMKLPIGEVADRAARAILTFTGPRAVCLDPAGRVSIEFPGHAAECDLVGVYAPSAGLLALSRMLIEDLNFEAIDRGFRSPKKTGRPRKVIAMNPDNYELAA